MVERWRKELAYMGDLRVNMENREQKMGEPLACMENYEQKMGEPRPCIEHCEQKMGGSRGSCGERRDKTCIYTRKTNKR